MKYFTTTEKTNNILHDRFLWLNPIPVNEALITSVDTKTSIENDIKDRLNMLDVGAEISIDLATGSVDVCCLNFIKH